MTTDALAPPAPAGAPPDCLRPEDRADLLALAARVDAALSRLDGPSADSVAAALAGGGFRGRRLAGDACPVARYLAAAVRPGPRVSVNVGRYCAYLLKWYGGPDDCASGEERVPLPLSVHLFVREFDHGLFPALATVLADLTRTFGA